MKTVLITGGNRGIGFETARQLATREFHVVIGSRSEQHGQKAVRELERLGKASLLVVDVSDSKSVASAASEFSSIGHLDVLINNAGIYPDEAVSVLTISREQMVGTFQTNTFGALEMIQAFLPYLKKSAAARVINVSSGYGQLDGLSANVPSYCLSKLALNGLTIMLAEALRHDGIAMNSMCPGWVRTDMGGSDAEGGYSETLDHEVRRFGVRAMLIEPAFTKTKITGHAKSAKVALDVYAAERKRRAEFAEREVERGDDRRRVAETVWNALSAESPRLRYPVGKGVVLSRLRRFAPAGMFDRSLRKQFQLY
jgi:NAD(P)-dependent dehydrogenase (short-subunit alcohol dehydrogenase family)